MDGEEEDRQDHQDNSEELSLSGVKLEEEQVVKDEGDDVYDDDEVKEVLELQEEDQEQAQVQDEGVVDEEAEIAEEEEEVQQYEEVEEGFEDDDEDDEDSLEAEAEASQRPGESEPHRTYIVIINDDGTLMMNPPGRPTAQYNNDGGQTVIPVRLPISKVLNQEKPLVGAIQIDAETAKKYRVRRKSPQVVLIDDQTKRAYEVLPDGSERWLDEFANEQAAPASAALAETMPPAIESEVKSSRSSARGDKTSSSSSSKRHKHHRRHQTSSGGSASAMASQVPDIAHPAELEFEDELVSLDMVNLEDVLQPDLGPQGQGHSGDALWDHSYSVQRGSSEGTMAATTIPDDAKFLTPTVPAQSNRSRHRPGPASLTGRRSSGPPAAAVTPTTTTITTPSTLSASLSSSGSSGTTSGSGSSTPSASDTSGGGRSPVVKVRTTSSGSDSSISPDGSIRRSQRQQDRFERQEAERILAENKEMLQKEREIMKAAAHAHAQSPGPGAQTQPPLGGIGAVGGHPQVQLTPSVPVFSAIPDADRKTIILSPAAVSTRSPKVTTVAEILRKQLSPERSQGQSQSLDTPTRAYPKRENRKMPAYLADPNYVSLVDVEDLKDERRGDDKSRELAVTMAMEMDDDDEEAEVKPEADAASAAVELVDLAGAADYDDVDYDNAAANEDVDDPHKLWCICRQPHNNRFMICCDRCQEWFHGKCVGVTKAQGKAIEESEQSWHCPPCKKILRAEASAQAKKTPTRRTSSTSDSHSRGSPAATTSPARVGSRRNSNSAIAITPKLKQTELPVAWRGGASSKIVKEAAKTISSSGKQRKDSTSGAALAVAGGNNCIACGKSTRSDAVFCSQDCIVKHSKRTNSTITSTSSRPKALTLTTPSGVTPAKATCTPTSPLKSPPLPGSKLKRTNSKADANAAAEAVAAENFLTFHVITPGNKSTEVVPAKQKISPPTAGAAAATITPPPATTTTTATIPAATPTTTMTPATKSLIGLGQPKVLVKKLSANTAKNVEVAVATRPRTASLTATATAQPTTTTTATKKSAAETPTPTTPRGGRTSTNTGRERHSSNSAAAAEAAAAAVKPKKKESAGNAEAKLRETMRKSISEILLGRVRTSVEGELVEDYKNPVRMGGRIEEELVRCFGSWSNIKCKNKYRSIIFNLKDQKNSLYRELLNGTLQAKELVRMEAHQMASAELSEWRLREAAKELEAISRSEIDKLAEAKKQELMDAGTEFDKVASAEQEARSMNIADLIVTEDDVPVAVVAPQPIVATFATFAPTIETMATATTDSKTSRERHRSHGHGHGHGHSSSSSAGSSRDKKKDKDKSASSSSRPRSHHKSGSDKDKNLKRQDSTTTPSEATTTSSDKSSGSSRSKDKSKGSKDRNRKKPLERQLSFLVSGDSASAASMDDQVSTGSASNSTTTRTPTYQSSEDSSPFDPTATAPTAAARRSRLDSEPQELPSSTIKTPDFTDESAAQQSGFGFGRQRGGDNGDGDGDHGDADSASALGDPAFKPILRTKLIMPELGQFNAVAYNVSHNQIGGTFFPEAPVPIVGRISPDIVWDYINKMKKNKELIILRLAPATPADTEVYMSFFTYLSARERFGVLGGITAPLKDVYLVPLDKRSPVNRTLLPFQGPGLPQDRNHCLLAVVTRHDMMPSLTKRLSTGGAAGETTLAKKKPKLTPAPPALKAGMEIKAGLISSLNLGTTAGAVAAAAGSITRVFPKTAAGAGAGGSRSSPSLSLAPAESSTSSSDSGRKIGEDDDADSDKPYTPWEDENSKGENLKDEGDSSTSPPDGAPTQAQILLQELNERIERQKQEIQIVQLSMSKSSTMKAAATSSATLLSSSSEAIPGLDGEFLDVDPEVELEPADPPKVVVPTMTLTTSTTTKPKTAIPYFLNLPLPPTAGAGTGSQVKTGASTPTAVTVGLGLLPEFPVKASPELINLEDDDSPKKLSLPVPVVPLKVQAQAQELAPYSPSAIQFSDTDSSDDDELEIIPTTLTKKPEVVPPLPIPIPTPKTAIPAFVDIDERLDLPPPNLQQYGGTTPTPTTTTTAPAVVMDLDDRMLVDLEPPPLSPAERPHHSIPINISPALLSPQKLPAQTTAAVSGSPLPVFEMHPALQSPLKTRININLSTKSLPSPTPQLPVPVVQLESSAAPPKLTPRPMAPTLGSSMSMPPQIIPQSSPPRLSNSSLNLQDIMNTPPPNLKRMIPLSPMPPNMNFNVPPPVLMPFSPSTAINRNTPPPPLTTMSRPPTLQMMGMSQMPGLTRFAAPPPPLSGRPQQQQQEVQQFRSSEGAEMSSSSQQPPLMPQTPGRSRIPSGGSGEIDRDRGDHERDRERQRGAGGSPPPIFPGSRLDRNSGPGHSPGFRGRRGQGQGQGDYYGDRDRDRARARERDADAFVDRVPRNPAPVVAGSGSHRRNRSRSPAAVIRSRSREPERDRRWFPQNFIRGRGEPGGRGGGAGAGSRGQVRRSPGPSWNNRRGGGGRRSRSRSRSPAGRRTRRHSRSRSREREQPKRSRRGSRSRSRSRSPPHNSDRRRGHRSRSRSRSPGRLRRTSGRDRDQTPPGSRDRNRRTSGRDSPPRPGSKLSQRSDSRSRSTTSDGSKKSQGRTMATTSRRSRSRSGSRSPPPPNLTSMAKSSDSRSRSISGSGGSASGSGAKGQGQGQGLLIEPETTLREEFLWNPSPPPEVKTGSDENVNATSTSGSGPIVNPFLTTRPPTPTWIKTPMATTAPIAFELSEDEDEAEPPPPGAE